MMCINYIRKPCPGKRPKIVIVQILVLLLNEIKSKLLKKLLVIFTASKPNLTCTNVDWPKSCGGFYCILMC
jgi:hypothetical protein